MKTEYFSIDPDEPFLTTVYLFDVCGEMPFGLTEVSHVITEVQTSREARGRGHARELMREVLADADREGAVLGLAAQPDGSIGALDEAALANWYRRLGFKELETDPAVMVRNPIVHDKE